VTVERRGGWPGPRKVQKVVPQPPVQVERVQAYADAEGVTYAEAMRRLVDAGLDEWQRPGRTGRPRKVTEKETKP